MSHGIKPIWVFDGKPPAVKIRELVKRKKSRLEAEAKQIQAIKDGDLEKAKKMATR